MCRDNQKIASLARRNTLIMASYIFALCVFFTSIYYLCGNVYYDSGDDGALNMIAAGAYNSDTSAFLIYSNILWGSLLKVLHETYPTVNMYLLLIVTLNTLSFFLISLSFCFGVMKREVANVNVKCVAKSSVDLRRIQYISISTLFVGLLYLLFGPDFFNSLQYTKNSALYTAAGIATIYTWYKNGGNFNNLFWVCGIVFCLIGFWVRDSSFFAAVGIMLFGFAASVLFSKDFKMGSIKRILQQDSLFIVKKNKPILIVMACLFILITISFVANEIAYSSPEWKYALEYNRYRTQLLDFGIPSYVDNKEFYTELGIDELDLQLLSQWIYADYDKFSLETLREICTLKLNDEKTLISVECALNAINNIYNVFLKHPIPFAWMIILVALVCLKRSKLIKLYVVVSFAIFIEYYYFTYIGRLVWRVQVIPWVSAIVFMICQLVWDTNDPMPSCKSTCSFALIMTVSLCMFILQATPLYLNFRTQKNFKFFQDDGWIMAAYNELNNRNEHFFVINVFSMNMMDNIAFINHELSDEHPNLYFTGGWPIPTPHFDQALKKWDIDNPLLALITDNDYCYYVDSRGSQELLRAYLEKEFGRPIKVAEVDHIPGYSIWQFGFEQND